MIHSKEFFLHCFLQSLFEPMKVFDVNCPVTKGTKLFIFYFEPFPSQFRCVLFSPCIRTTEWFGNFKNHLIPNPCHGLGQLPLIQVVIPNCAAHDIGAQVPLREDNPDPWNSNLFDIRR